MAGLGLCVAIESCLFEADGQLVTLREGAILVAGHPFIRARPGLFEPLTIKIDYPPDGLAVDEATIRIAGNDAGEYGHRMVMVAAVRTRPADISRR